MFHRTAPRFEAAYTDLSGREHAQAMNAEQRSADIRAAHGWLDKLMGDRTDDVQVRPGADTGGCCRACERRHADRAESAA